MINRVRKQLIEEIKHLTKILNEYTEAYNNGCPVISDSEWDTLYFRLAELEICTGYCEENSPTQKVIYSSVTELKKVEHNHPMLSLEKTKSEEEVFNFFGDKHYVAMAKMDGLTCSLLYENGRLIRAETRGNGLVGDDVTHNALVIKTIPKRINYKNRLVVDGEIICDKKTFEENFSTLFKNPRNFAAGGIRLLNGKQCEARKLKFVAWDVIEGFENSNSLFGNLCDLCDLGFTVVPFFSSMTKNFSKDLILDEVEANHYPIDGLVFKFDDIAYGKSLGATDHHFKNAIAFKFVDEIEESKLITIDWTLGRTGILTPVAVFEPVELEGTTVQRASIHNLTILKDTFHGLPWVGQAVKVYKAHMINPQILEADDAGDFLHYPELPFLEVPTVCPVCGGHTEVKCDVATEFLVCANPDCEGKLINRLDHFAGKKGLDIRGLSKATLEKLIDWSWVEKTSDLFKLHNYRNDWINKPGFGERSVDNILHAIEEAKVTTLDAFIASLGIPLIGKAVAKEVIKLFPTYEEFRAAIEEGFDFTQLDGFAEAKTNALLEFDYKEADYIFENFLKIFRNEIITTNDSNCKDLKIVITGTLHNFKNRDEFKNEIEKRGGKVVNTITKSTSFLINNDINSTTSKNKRAKELDVPIISEQDFINKYFI